MNNMNKSNSRSARRRRSTLPYRYNRKSLPAQRQGRLGSRSTVGPSSADFPSGHVGRDSFTAVVRSPNQMVMPAMPIFRTRTRRTLTYYDANTLSGTGFGATGYLFTASGLFDPNITGVGHQPSGFDQLMVFYDHYVVLRANITVTFKNTLTAASPCIALSLNSSNSVVTNVQQLMESGYCEKDRLGFTQGDLAIKTLQIAVDNARFGGVDDILDDSDYHGSITTNPIEQTYFQLSAFDPSGASVQVDFEVLITYEAMFIEPRIVTTSLSSALHKLVLSEDKKTSK